MADRKAKIERKTNETDIVVELNLDGQGRYEIDTGVGFFDHMLTHLSKHSRIDMTVKARGDLHIDDHQNALRCFQFHIFHHAFTPELR